MDTELFILITDIIGTVAFAVSGAMAGIRKKMDIFGVNILALLTATGGGIIRKINDRLIIQYTGGEIFIEQSFGKNVSHRNFRNFKEIN